MVKIPNLKLNNGINVPILGLGTWKLNGETCIRSVKKALELGYRHIDTAEIYGNEDEIGRAINGLDRKELFITSKVFPYPFSLKYYNILKSCEKSLSKLNTPYLDLFLIHWPRKTKDLSYLKAFKRLIDDNKILSFGVSNFTINHLKEIISVAEEIELKISINQVEFHPILYQKELLNFCNQNKISMTAYSPLARGGVYNNKILQGIGEKYKKTPGQISLRWLVQKGLIAIPKASSNEHLMENLDIFNFKLNNEEINLIDSINQNKRFVNPVYAEFDY